MPQCGDRVTEMLEAEEKLDAMMVTDMIANLRKFFTTAVITWRRKPMQGDEVCMHVDMNLVFGP